ncbi:MAG: hypothetical protein V4437_00520 [Patescibacteria group bacterium]
MAQEGKTTPSRLRGSIIEGKRTRRTALKISDGITKCVISGAREQFDHWMGANPGMNFERERERGILQVKGDEELIKRANGDFIILAFDMM